jgi:predicted dehydrogenase
LSQPRRFRAAIVGAGAIAESAHLPALRAHARRVELVAAVDVDPRRVEAFAQRHRIAGAYGSLAEMLEKQKPDLVHVCTPPAAHVDAVVECLQAGAWVLVEKPPVLSLAEYDLIERAERPGGPYASVVYQHRFGSGALRLARQAAAGQLGRPMVAQCVTAWYRDAAYYRVPWRGTWAGEGGGPTMGHGIHQMDLLLAILGDWAEVRAMAGRLDRAVETEDVSLASVRFASGALASVVNSVLSPREESLLRFDFEDATVEVAHLYGYTDADWRYTPAPHAAADTDRVAGWTAPDRSVGSSHAAQLTYVLDALERGERPPTSGRAGRATLELITALYRSAFTGAPVLRGEIGPSDPFYHRLHGDVPGWAPPVARESGSRLPRGGAESGARVGDEGAAMLYREPGSVLSGRVGGVEILRYHYKPDLPRSECPSPYFHPLRTLSGGVVTANRPHDHRWHKGLAMTASHLAGQNFWGGGTYVHDAPGSKYVDLPNVGRLDHEGFEDAALDVAGPSGFGERVAWRSADGEVWIAERRRVRIRDVDPDDGSWALEFSTALRNVRGSALEFGSPTVFGRELAGYCGFFWRGPRSFTGGTVRASRGREGEPAAMGQTSPWLAFSGRFDQIDGSATLLFIPDPANPGGEPYWFVRTEPFPVVNPSLAYYTPLELAAGETLSRRYRLVVADGEWDHERIEAYVAEHPW